MILVGLILVIIGLVLAVFWRRDPGAVLVIVGIVLLLVGLATGGTLSL